MRGFRIARVSNAVLTLFILGDLDRSYSDLPHDVEVVGIVPPSAHDVQTACVSFLLTSEEWEPTPEGAVHQQITPVYRSMGSDE